MRNCDVALSAKPAIVALMRRLAVFHARYAAIPLLLLCHSCCCGLQAPGDDPVWRQLLQFILEKGEPEAAVGAAAALAQRQ